MAVPSLFRTKQTHKFQYLRHSELINAVFEQNAHVVQLEPIIWPGVQYGSKKQFRRSELVLAYRHAEKIIGLKLACKHQQDCSFQSEALNVPTAF